MVKFKIKCQLGDVMYNLFMQTCLLVHPEVILREEKATGILSEQNLSRSHPDLLWFEAESKLGIEQAREIKDFLSLKPYQGNTRAVVLIAAEELTDAAQNALLKTLEEPPENTVLILGTASEDQLLPTVISRCRVINLTGKNAADASFDKDIEKLLELPMEKRFQFIEKLDKKDEFLPALTAYFRSQMLESNDPKSQKFLKVLLEAERWAKQNVNIRAILEYLMLKLPSDKNE